MLVDVDVRGQQGMDVPLEEVLLWIIDLDFLNTKMQLFSQSVQQLR